MVGIEPTRIHIGIDAALNIACQAVAYHQHLGSVGISHTLEAMIKVPFLRLGAAYLFGYKPRDKILVHSAALHTAVLYRKHTVGDKV